VSSAAHLEDERHLRREEDGDFAAFAEGQVRRQLPRLLLEQHDRDECFARTCRSSAFRCHRMTSTIIGGQLIPSCAFHYRPQLSGAEVYRTGTSMWAWMFSSESPQATCVVPACTIDSPVSRKAMTCKQQFDVKFVCCTH
jgi:hypothetical protein